MKTLYFLTHLTISMAITGLIGLFGNMYEPGPVPRLMMILAGVYLGAYFIGWQLYLLWKREHKESCEEESKCYFYNLSEETEEEE